MLRILLPTDFSENSKRAIEYVLEHFKKDEVKLLLIHTIKAPHSAAGVLIRIDDLMRKDAERDMKELVYDIKNRHGVEAESIIKIGHLSDWLKQYASSYAIDLIAMGTKGQSNMAYRFLGSVTEAVIRTSEVPVLAVPLESEHSRVHHLAIATDGERIPHERTILEFLSALNMEHPRMNVLKVLDNEGELMDKSMGLNGFQVSVTPIQNASVVDGINAYLAEVPTDLLIMYHKRNSTFDYLFNRSVTKNICGTTHTPLLVIPK